MACNMEHEEPRMICSICGYGQKEDYRPFAAWGVRLNPARVAQCKGCKKMSKHIPYIGDEGRSGET